MLDMQHDLILAAHRPLWQDALPYLDVRRNDKHTLYCYHFAKALLELTPSANQEIVLLGILLHDVGWKKIPEDKLLHAFGPNQKYPELQVQHEKEGAVIAEAIMEKHGIEAEVVARVVKIIDGHDTRKEALSLEDALVKDADKLWRYTPFGLAMLAEWFDYTKEKQLQLLDKWLQTRFYTQEAITMATGLRYNLDLN